MIGKRFAIVFDIEYASMFNDVEINKGGISLYRYRGGYRSALYDGQYLMASKNGRTYRLATSVVCGNEYVYKYNIDDLIDSGKIRGTVVRVDMKEYQRGRREATKRIVVE